MTTTPDDTKVRSTPFDEFLVGHEQSQYPHSETTEIVDLRDDVSRAMGYVGFHLAKGVKLGSVLHGGTPGGTAISSTRRKFKIAATDTLLHKLVFTGNVADTETITIGAVTYEFDTNGAYTPGNIPVDVSTSLAKVYARDALLAAIQTNQTYLAVTDGVTSTNPWIYFEKDIQVGKSGTNFAWSNQDEVEELTIMVPSVLTQDNIVQSINIALSMATGLANKKTRCWYDYTAASPGYCFTGPSTFTAIAITAGTAPDDMAAYLLILNTSLGAYSLPDVNLREVVSGEGGFHTAVADETALRAVPADELKDKMFILCETRGGYRFDAQSNLADDPVTFYVVRPTACAATDGRFIKVFGTIAYDTQVACTKTDIGKKVIQTTSDLVSGALDDLDEAAGYGSLIGPVIVGGATGVTDISGAGANCGFRIDTGAGVEDVTIVDPSGLTSAALITSAVNALLAACAVGNNSRVRLRRVGGRWVLVAPIDVASITIGAFGGGGADLAKFAGANRLILDYGESASIADGCHCLTQGSLANHLALHLDPTLAKHDADQVDYEKSDLLKRVIGATSDQVELAIGDLDNNLGAGVVGVPLVMGGLLNPATTLVPLAALPGNPDAGFGLNVNGAGAQDVVIPNATLATLNTAALIETYVNGTLIPALTGDNRKAQLRYLDGHWFVFGAFNTTEAGSTIAVTAPANPALTDLTTAVPAPGDGRLELVGGARTYSAQWQNAIPEIKRLETTTIQRGTVLMGTFVLGVATVTLPYALPAAAAYSVVVSPGENLTWWITGKTNTQFVINLSAQPLVGNVDWLVVVQ